jgi:hypothetical protein
MGKSPRTSQTHPLQIGVVDAGDGGGKIGITFAPGKQDQFAFSGPWSRDLGLDLDVIAKWKAKVVVTLIEPHERRYFAFLISALRFVAGALSGSICRFVM